MIIINWELLVLSVIDHECINLLWVCLTFQKREWVSILAHNTYLYKKWTYPPLHCGWLWKQDPDIRLAGTLPFKYALLIPTTANQEPLQRNLKQTKVCQPWLWMHWLALQEVHWMGHLLCHCNPRPPFRNGLQGTCGDLWKKQYWHISSAGRLTFNWEHSLNQLL